MATKHKMDKYEAKEEAKEFGIDFHQDYHQLRNNQVDELLRLAKKIGYRKPSGASGSTGRYFFYYLQRA